MKGVIRNNVFETNSSSVHALSILTKDEYNKWNNNNYVLVNDWCFRKSDEKPVRNRLYTEEEMLEFIRKLNPNYELNKRRLGEYGFYSTHDFFDNHNYEIDEIDYISPSGEEFVVSSFYGMDD